MRRIVWTLAVSVASAAGAALAARAANAIWCKVTHSPPPETPWWARWIVGKPAQAGIRGALQR